MKRLVTILAIAGLVSLPVAAFAGIAGSDHDRGGQICQNCHIPHNAQGDKLWFEAPSGTFTGIQDLCYSCHDGSVTSVGLTTAFNAALEQHIGITANGSTGDCDGCHDVHNQNPNGTGKFLYTDVVKSANNEYCSSCHDGDGGVYSAADVLGNHTYGATGTTNHYNGSGFSCVQCHTPHGATAQTTNPAGLTNPILLADNQPGATYGAFCISCHNGTIPTGGVTGAGGVASANTFDYTMGVVDATTVKHPTTTATVGGCNYCHDVHNPSTATTNLDHLLLAENADGAYCTSCHTGGGGPTIGTSHPYNVAPTTVDNTGLTPALPWSDEIDDDPGDLVFSGTDYTNASTGLIVCESCHSAHRQGVYAPLLRETNAANELCGSCHPANY